MRVQRGGRGVSSWRLEGGISLIKEGDLDRLCFKNVICYVSTIQYSVSTFSKKNSDATCWFVWAIAADMEIPEHP